MKKEISSFQGKYRFLSNFWVDDTGFCVEMEYQAAKGKTWEDVAKIKACRTPGEAKRAGRQIEIRNDWERIKDQQMLFLIRLKFDNSVLKKQLLATKDAELIEGNYWHDNYWGSCTCPKCGNKGQNKLGKILMKVRDELNADHNRK